MKIASIGQKQIPGTSVNDRAATGLATHLVRKGHNVNAYVQGRRSTEASNRYNGVNLVAVHELPFIGRLNTAVRLLASFLHVSFVFRPAVIHLHGAFAGLFSWILKIIRPQSTLIISLHDVEYKNRDNGLIRRMVLNIGEKCALRFAHQVVATTKVVANHISVVHGKRVPFVPNGVDIQRVSTNDVILNPFDLRSHGYALAVVPASMDANEFGKLLDEWKHACSNAPAVMQNIRLAIVAENEESDKKIKKHAVNDPAVVLVGVQRREVLKALFAGARFVIHPFSNSDGLRIILQGMSFGKAVVAPNAPAFRDVVRNYGVLFEAEKQYSLASCITNAVVNPTDTASTGHQARVFVEQMYNWQERVEEVIEIYKNHRALREGVLAIR